MSYVPNPFFYKKLYYCGKFFYIYIVTRMYSKIVNPMTGRRISITGKLGKIILRNYINILMGEAAVHGGDADTSRLPLRSLAYIATSRWGSSEETRVGAARDFATLVADNKIVYSDIVSLQSWITENSNGKHILIEDMHGRKVHPFFLSLTLDALRASHKKLIFEALITGGSTLPTERIERIQHFFGPIIKHNSRCDASVQDYITVYEKAITNGFVVEPGDYDWGQAEHYSDRREHLKARYRMNDEIATNKISNQSEPVIAFYGKEHTVSRRSHASDNLGIPDYLAPGTFFVYRPIIYPYTGYSKQIKNLVENATSDLTENKIVIVPCELDIDWGHYFILIPKDLVP